jgi:hypothetical protein
MNDKHTKKQGDKIKFKLKEVELSGEVNGEVGPILIVKLDTPLKDYPFTHIYIIDSQIIA